LILSVIIPTHERSRYAVSTIQSILKIDGIEVVVSDTSDDDRIGPLFQEAQSLGRLKLHRPGRALSVVDNFNAALCIASGKYIAFLGDDDFVHESIVDIVRWAHEKGVDSLRCTFPASYYWPDFVSRYFGKGYSAKLAINSFSGKARKVNPVEAYRSALLDLGAGVKEMPRAYLGVLSRGLVERIRHRHGSLFGGVSPDIYSAALIANNSVSCFEIDYPFIVPGSSGASTSGQSAVGAHKGRLRENAHIAAFKDLRWDERVPEFYSVPTVWSYSLLRAASHFGDDESAGFGRLYVKCILMMPTFWREILRSALAQASRKGTAAMVGQLCMALMHEMGFQLHRVMRRVFRPAPTGAADVVDNVSDCLVASDALDNYLKRQSTAPLLDTAHDSRA
jgi:hypothetical protein